MLVRKRPTPGTPIAKSASFLSANSLTWRGVMICSASSLRSSGLSGGSSSPWRSPLIRTVGGRPTLSSKSDAFRWTIWAIVFLKLKLDCGAGLASAIGIDPEENLPEFHRLTVLDRDLSHDARDLRLDLVHDLHRFDDADRLTRSHPVPHPDVGLGTGFGCLIERADHWRTDFLEVRGRRRPGPGVAVFCVSGRSREGQRGHLDRDGGNRSGGSPGDDDAGTEPTFHLDRTDLRRLAQKLSEPPDVLEVDGAYARHVLQQLGQLLHLLGAHTRVKYLSSRRSTRITWPSSMKSGTCTVAPVSRTAGLVPPVAVSPRTPGAVRVTVSSTNDGSSTVMTRSL